MAVGSPTVFISYPRRDAASLAFAAEAESVLRTAGFEVWRDIDIEPGDRWPDQLWRWLLECSAAVVVLNQAAIDSEWCRREWSVLAARASHADLKVVPVQLDDVGSTVFDSLQMLDAGPDAVDAVLAALEGVAGAPPGRADYLAAHLAWLREQYREAPVLGREPYTLHDVYVDTECGVVSWAELEADKIDPFAEEQGGRRPLIDVVLELFADPAFREPVVVQGPAGSGKSAFTLHLADRLIDEGLIPVLIRFRDLRLASHGAVDELLQDAVRIGPIETGAPPPRQPLFDAVALDETVALGSAEISRTVVILDGWDEVTITGSARFKDQLDEWLPKVRQYFADRPGPPVRLVVTGRPSPLVDRSGLLRRETSVLTVRPMRPAQLRAYAQAIAQRLDGTEWTLDVAACEAAFEHYERWFLHGDQGGADADVLGSPLLALLAFRTMADWKGAVADLFDRPTALFHALIEVTVAHAGKAADMPDGTVHRGGEQLRRLLQWVATVMTCQGGESVSFAELEARLEDGSDLLDWADEATIGNALHALFVNFYFRRSQRELGCEFLHKSFREYLFAEAIVATLEELSEGRSGPHPTVRGEWTAQFPPGSVEERASRSLAALLAPVWLTREVRDHLFWLVERAVHEDRDRWVWVRDLLNDVYAWWADACHLRSARVRLRGRMDWDTPLVVDLVRDALPRDDRDVPSAPSTFDYDAHLGDALLQLTAFVHALLVDAPMAGERMCQVDDRGRIRFRPFDDDALQLIARISSDTGRPMGPELSYAYLGETCLAGEDLAGRDLSGANLRGADLREIDGSRVQLSDADLVLANLTKAWMGGAHLAMAQLTNAVLVDAMFGAASFAWARLDGADLSRADLQEASLDWASAKAAIFRGADLTSVTGGGADLKQVDFTGARLHQARLRQAELDQAVLCDVEAAGAELVEASLVGADLSGVRLRRAALISADLTGAKLDGADLREADLTYAVLVDVDLDGVDLSGATVEGAVLPS